MQAAPEPQHYIFIANSVDYEPFTTGDELTRVLASKRMWLASRFTPFRKAYKNGVRVILYVAGKGARHFVGDAAIEKPTTNASDEEIQFAKRLGLEGFTEEIPLLEICLWSKPLAIRPLVDNLAFIKDKINYGLNLRQAAAKITARDYDYIISLREK
jgi:predicted RNA-binding protein